MKTLTRDQFRRPAGLAAVPFLAASVVCLSVAVAGVRNLDPRTIYYVALGVVLVSLVAGLLIRSSATTETAAVAVAAAQLTVAILGRVGALFSSPTGLPDTTDAPLNTAGLLVLGAGILLSGRRAGPDRQRLGIAKCMRRGITLVVTLLLGTVGVLSALSEVQAVNLSSGGKTLLTDLVEGPGNEPVRQYTLVAQEQVIQGEAYWMYNGTVSGSGDPGRGGGSAPDHPGQPSTRGHFHPLARSLGSKRRGRRRRPHARRRSTSCELHV